MKTFKDLVFKPHSIGNGVQAILKFDNKYGISVVKFNGSYGYSKDLWEIAILDKELDLCYSTPITDDVIGYLSDDEVTDIMKQIQTLPECK